MVYVNGVLEFLLMYMGTKVSLVCLAIWVHST